MTFATDYLHQLEQIGARLSLPAVRALHLPPLAEGARKWGEFCALELEDGALGSVVRVANADSGRTVDAVVSGPGSVEANASVFIIN